MGTIWNVVQVLFVNDKTEYPYVTADVVASCNTLRLAEQYLEDRIAYFTEGGYNGRYEYLGHTYNAHQLLDPLNGAILQLSVEPSQYTES